MRTVRAAVMDGVGSIVMRDYPYPEVAEDSGVLKVEATGITGSDYELYSDLGKGSHIPFPFIPGHIIVGTIDALGPKAAARWGVKQGDRVVLNNSVYCGKCKPCQAGDRRGCTERKGYGLWFDFESPPYLWGGAAEYMALHPDSEMALVPEGVSPVHACAQERLASVVNWLVRQGGLSIYDNLVVIGTGMLGLAAVMVAKIVGVRKCIVVGRKGSTRLELARQVGADVVVTGSEDEIAAGVMAATGGRGADICIDLSDASAVRSTAIGIRCLARRGRMIQIAVKDLAEITGVTASDLIHRELTLRGALSRDHADVQLAMDLLAKGQPAAMANLPLAVYGLEETKRAMDTPPGSVGALMTVIVP